MSMVKPITKYATVIRKAADIRYELEKAYFLATSGRPGPVLLDVPMDIQRAKVSSKLKGYLPPSSEGWEINKIVRVLNYLRQAKRPAILLGGGVWLAGASEQAKILARKLKSVPFFVTWNMIDHYDPKFFGGKVGTFGGDGRNFGIQNCDFLLAIGSRISGRITGGMQHTFARAARKIIVDIDKYEMKFQQTKGDLNIYCDAKVFINEFTKAFRKSPKFGANIDPTWLARVKEWENRYPVVRKEYVKQKGSVNPYIFVKVLSELMNSGDVCEDGRSRLRKRGLRKSQSERRLQ